MEYWESDQIDDYPEPAQHRRRRRGHTHHCGTCRGVWTHTGPCTYWNVQGWPCPDHTEEKCA